MLKQKDKKGLVEEKREDGEWKESETLNSKEFELEKAVRMF